MLTIDLVYKIKYLNYITLKINHKNVDSKVLQYQA